MAGPADVYDLCAEWLAVCQAAIATAAGGAITERAYVSPSPPTFDCCPQLTVHLGGPAEADTLPLQPPLAAGHRDTVQGSVHLINMTATVVRCLGLGEGIPTTAALEDAARETCGDVWAIWNHTRRRHKAGSLFASPSGSRELILDAAFPVQPPLGGCAGWQIPIRVALGGYPA